MILTCKIRFVKFHQKLASYFLSRGKKCVDVSLAVCEHIYKKIKIGIPLTCISTVHVGSTFRSVVDLKLKFWDSNVENIGFHLTSKFILLPVEPWEMKLQWEHPL